MNTMSLLPITEEQVQAEVELALTTMMNASKEALIRTIVAAVAPAVGEWLEDGSALSRAGEAAVFRVCAAMVQEEEQLHLAESAAREVEA